MIYTKYIKENYENHNSGINFSFGFTVIKLSGIVAISKLMKPSEKQIEEARQKRLQAEKEGKDPFEDWDERDDDGLV